MPIDLTPLLLAALKVGVTAMESLAKPGAHAAAWRKGSLAREAVDVMTTALLTAGQAPASSAYLHAGDPVTLVHQDETGLTLQCGVVIAVVREDDDPRKCVPAGYHYKGRSKPRAQRSYLVQVGRSKALAWPLVAFLRAAAAK